MTNFTDGTKVKVFTENRFEFIYRSQYRRCPKFSSGENFAQTNPLELIFGGAYTEVADFSESRRQNVQQKSADELMSMEY